MTLKTFIQGDSTNAGIIVQIIEPLVVLMFSAAVFFFLWNVFMLITKSDQPEEMAAFKSRVFWGIIAIAVMASMWGIVALILGSTGLDTTATINIRTGQ